MDVKYNAVEAEMSQELCSLKWIHEIRGMGLQSPGFGLALASSLAPPGGLLLLHLPTCCKMSYNVFAKCPSQQSPCVFSL